MTQLDILAESTQDAEARRTSPEARAARLALLDAATRATGARERGDWEAMERHQAEADEARDALRAALEVAA